VNELVKFDSLNPYESMESLTARSPDELLVLIKSIRTPIKIISIVGQNNRYTAFVMGDIRIKKPRNQMTNVAAYKAPGKVWNLEKKLVKFTYDFAVDGGAQGTLKMGKLDDKALIIGSWVQVETACVGATATVTIGLNTTDADCFLTTAHGAVATMGDDAVWSEAAGQGIVCPADNEIDLVIATAALTAGKINLFVEYINVV
jgi:hypothetical protein